eukprot:TRINITY_DN506_c0_g1_i1.p1 TRINITY_DN506_c0_g1~~TRINITY_DN506_c0_g1_i1.p1  ORF type:complete len:474 (-),score=88.33 TRINITY_DN506_c0_g1_i1:725-2125(-)
MRKVLCRSLVSSGKRAQKSSLYSYRSFHTSSYAGENQSNVTSSANNEARDRSNAAFNNNVANTPTTASNNDTSLLPEISKLKLNTVASVVHEAVRKFEHREFISSAHEGDSKFTFIDTYRAAHGAASGYLISLNCDKHESVGWLTEHSAYHMIAPLAAARSETVWVPLNPASMTPETLRQVLRDGKLHTLVLQPTYFGRSNFDLVDEAIPEMRGWTGTNPVALRRYPDFRTLITTGDYNPSGYHLLSSIYSLEPEEDPLPVIKDVSPSAPMARFLSNSTETPSRQSFTHSQGSVLSSTLSALKQLPFFSQATNLALVSPSWSSPLTLSCALLPSIIHGSLLRIPSTRFHTGTILHSLSLYRSNTVFVSYAELAELLEDETINELDFDRIENLIIGTLDGVGVGGYTTHDSSLTSAEKQDMVNRVSKYWKNLRNVVGVRGSLEAGLWGVEEEHGRGFKVLGNKKERK